MEDLTSLVELQKIDSEIMQKTALIEEIPLRVSSVEQPLKEAQGLLRLARQKYDAALKRKKEKDALLDDVGEKIRKLKTRISEIKTNKEYQAHLKEIEAAERDRYSAEDEVLSLMESLDAAQKEMKEHEAVVSDEEKKIAAFRKVLEAEVSEAERELEALRELRKKFVTSLDPEIYNIYFQLLETKRGIAVVEARDEVCQGCNMNIPPQLCVEIRRAEKIFQCPQCSRILFCRS